MPMSLRAFSTFQHGCPPTFTHSFLQRCSVTAIVASLLRQAEPAVSDSLRHVLRLLAVPRAVLELDRRIEPLARVLEHRVALARPRGPGRGRVLDPHLLGGLLDPPAGPGLQPFVLTAV